MNIIEHFEIIKIIENGDSNDRLFLKLALEKTKREINDYLDRLEKFIVK